MINNIAFPKLGLKFNINQVAIDVPFLGGVRWYGLLIGIGIVLAYLYCSRVCKKENENTELLTDILLCALPTAIICARTYYVIFSWDNYKDNLTDVFKIWEGGLAIYGGIIGAVAAAYICLKIKKVNVLKIFDICSLGLLIGQAVGRWGNFINAEAFGYPTNNLLGMSINGAASVHPTFLYESLWNVAGFIILSRMHKKRPYNGFTFFSYLMWYGLGRFFVEGMRTDSLYLGPVRISQMVAIVSMLIGILGNYLIVRKRTRKKSK